MNYQRHSEILDDLEGLDLKARNAYLEALPPEDYADWVQYPPPPSPSEEKFHAARDAERGLLVMVVIAIGVAVWWLS